MINYNLLMIFLIVIVSFFIASVVYKTKTFGNIIAGLSVLLIVISKNNEVLADTAILFGVAEVNILIAVYAFNFICTSSCICKAANYEKKLLRSQSLLEQTTSKLVYSEFENFKEAFESSIPHLKDSTFTGISLYVRRSSFKKYLLYAINENPDKNRLTKWLFKHSAKVPKIRNVGIFGDTNHLKMLKESKATKKIASFIANQTLRPYCCNITAIGELEIPLTEHSLDLNNTFTHVLWFNRIGSSPNYKFLKENVQVHIYLNLNSKTDITQAELDKISKLFEEHFKLFETAIESCN